MLFQFRMTVFYVYIVLISAVVQVNYCYITNYKAVCESSVQNIFETAEVISYIEECNNL